MKTKPNVLRAAGILLLSSLPLMATNPSMALVTHPVYLGGHADPDAIPLSAVPVWHNYGFGIHAVISNPRVFPGGPLDSEHGPEFNMNLASVYDIRVSPEDSTQVPLLPVTIVAGNRVPPAAARHSRGQALEATLWALILNTPASEERPLVVKIESDDPEHQKYAGSYVFDPADLTLVVGEISGSRLVRGARGVVSVVFQTAGNPLDLPAEPQDDGPTPQMAFVPMLSGGGAVGDEQLALVPHWAGRQEGVALLELLWTAVPRGMNVFSAKRGENANPLHAGPFDTQDPGKKPGTLRFYGSSRTEAVASDDQRLFAAACHGAIVSLSPTADEPLEISFVGYPPAAWEILAGDGWELLESPQGKETWRRSFTDAGQIILGHRLISRTEGGWWLEAIEPEIPDFSESGTPLPDGSARSDD